MANSDDDKKQKRNTYASKNDFMQIDIAQLHKTVELAVRSKKPLAIVGEAGIGKTAIVREVAEKLGMKCQIIMTSQKVPEDFSGIPVPDMENGVVRFLKLDELPRPKDGPTLLFFDEINQADHNVLRSIFQLLGERKLGTYTLPESCAMIAALNPDGANYQTAKPTPALRRRLCWVETRFEPLPWLSWASNAGLHPAVVEYCRRNPDAILNLASLRNDKVFACPASWESVSDVLNTLQEDDTPEDILPLTAGFIGKKIATAFNKFFANYSQQIDPKDIIFAYSKIQPKIKHFVAQGRTDILANLANTIVIECLAVDSKASNAAVAADNVGAFFVDLPNDIAVLFGRGLKDALTQKGDAEFHEFWVGAFFNNKPVSEKMIAMLEIAQSTKEAEELATATP